MNDLGDIGRAGASGETPAATAASYAASAPRRRRRFSPFWLKQLHSWHWISAAISLVGMLLFAITGITLNHAASINATPVVTTAEGRLTGPLLSLIKPAPTAQDAPLPDAVADAIRTMVHLDARGRAAEWSDEEVYVALPGPGRDGWISIDRTSGAITSERTERGAISYLNDLHKGRNTGPIWFWFIDIFSVACIVFTLTGLLLLQLHARHRRSTWPLVATGLAIPAAIALFLIH